MSENNPKPPFDLPRLPLVAELAEVQRQLGENQRAIEDRQSSIHQLLSILEENQQILEERAKLRQQQATDPDQLAAQEEELAERFWLGSQSYRQELNRFNASSALEVCSQCQSMPCGCLLARLVLRADGPGRAPEVRP